MMPAVHRSTDEEIAGNIRKIAGLKQLCGGAKIPDDLLDAAGLTLPPDLRPSDPAAVAGDRERLRRILPPELADDPAAPFPSVHQRRARAVAAVRAAPEVSDRAIAAWTGVCRETVARVRRELVAAGRIPDATARKGRDAKVYKKLPERKEETA